MLMSSIETLRLHTVNSRWLNRAYPLRAIPYARVVAVETASDILTATEHSPGDPQSQWEQDDVKVHDIEVDGDFSVRFLSFFIIYYQKSRPDWERYQNCHRFAFWMQGATAMNTDLAPLADRVIQNGTTVSLPGLELGRFATIASPTQVARQDFVGHHSVVGLGVDDERCLQVMEYEGYLGIEPIDSALRGCQVANDLSDAVLYSPSPADQLLVEAL